MRPQRIITAFDAADIDAESRFWATLLGGEVRADDEGDWHSIWVDGEYRLGVQLAPDHVPPQWPDGAPQQVHVDLYVADVEAAQAEVIAAGGRLLQDGDATQPKGWRVYADPAGHPFCLCWGDPAGG